MATAGPPGRARRPSPTTPPTEQVDGILNLRKPSGLTSMEVVRRIKRLTRQQRVGHAGTLDPLAEGVLPICFGQATRLMEFLVDAPKVYRATMLLGVITDTYDAQGAVVEVRDPSALTREQVEAAMANFLGVVYQVPPMYSALKHQGKRLYDLARAGVEVERAPRKVQVYRLNLVQWDFPSVTMEVECGRGLYIRSLAHDLGMVLGCGAHLTALTRLRSGPLRVEEGISLEEVEQGTKEGTWKGLLHAPDVALQNMDAAVVSRGMEQAIRQGRLVPFGSGRMYPAPVNPCRIYSADGRFLAVGRYDFVKGLWRPEKVLDTHPLDGGPAVTSSR